MTLGLPVEAVLAWPVPKFTLYAAFDQLEPFGDRQADLRAATVAALTVRAMGGSWIDPGELFASLKDDRPRAADKKNIGRGFRAWIASNCPVLVPIGPGQKLPQ